MNQQKLILIARKLYWTVKKFRLIYLTQLDRKIMLLLETIISAVVKDFYAYSRSQTSSLFRRLQSSGENTAVVLSFRSLKNSDK